MTQSNYPIVRLPYRKAPRRHISTIALVLCTSLLVSACKQRTALPDEVNTLVFKTLSGQDISLANVSAPVLINFWATDCAICIHEMPDLSQIFKHYEPEGFQLIAVAMPYDPPNRVLEMAEREQWQFTVALDITGEAVESFASVKGTPTSFLLDRNGQLITRYVGAIPMDKLRKQLDALLGLG